MLHLRTFGGLALANDDAHSVGAARQRKTLALLALLSAAGPVGLSRDKLLAYLWPEADAEHGRGLLKQACYALRRDLRAPDLFLGTSQLRLNPDIITSDVQAFEAALERRDLTSAAELYRGPFLDGFYLSDAPEFEHWTDAQRTRLQQRAVVALEQLATETEARGDPRRAVQWWRDLASIDPLDSRIVLGLMRALAAGGDRAGALHAARAHEKLLRDELDAAPDPTIRELYERLISESARSGAQLPTVSPGVRVEADVAAAQPAPGGGFARQRASARRRGSVFVAVLALSVLTGGWLLVRSRARSGGVTREPQRLAVLPFANLGPAEDEYFTSGITEEIVARLSTIDRLRVIASTSPDRSHGTQETIPEIGRKLGVRYVLEGSVRWEKSPQGRPRVRVTPQLVSTADGTHLWAEVYDEPLDEIFRVQSDIARKVAQALDVTLLETQRRVVEAVPTRNVEAHDYYLRGIDYTRRGLGRFQPAAVRMFEKAIELDSSFALAYAMLSRAQSRMYLTYYDHSQERLTKAKWAVERAFALDSGLPEAHQSLGTYYWIGETDYTRALREFTIVEAARPHDANLFVARAVLEGRQGKYADAISDFRKALELDPGSAAISSNYGENSDITRDYPRAESLYNHAIALSPDGVRPYFHKALMYLRRDGYTKQARAVLDEAQRVGLGDTPEIRFARMQVAIFDRRYEEALRWLSGFPDVFADQQRFITRASAYAQVYGLMQRPRLERAYADSARRVLLARLREQPDDSRLYSALGLVYASLGQKHEAIREGERGVALRPISKDTYQGYYRAWDLARVYIMVGEYDAAIDGLEHLVSLPGYLTPAWLRADPTWDPLRNEPRFQRLVTGARSRVDPRAEAGGRLSKLSWRVGRR